jgi:autotransporter-associated beta strand protein
LNAVGTSGWAGNITLAGNSTIAVQPTKTLSLSGTIDKDARVLTLTGGGTVNISGSIVGASAGSDLVVDGVNVNLSNTNTYNGPTFIRNGGTLTASVSGALPTGTRTAVSFDGTGASTLALGANQSIASLASALANSSVNLSGNTLTIGTASGTQTFSGAISGSLSGVIKDGASTQVLGGANSYTGPTTVQGGTLEIAGSLGGTITTTSAVTIGTSGALLISGDVSNTLGSASTNLNLAGGTLQFSGTSVTESLGQLNLTVSSTLDFGANFGNQVTFTLGVAAHTPNTTTLSIQNWSGTAETLGGASNDRLIFNGDTLAFNAFTAAFSPNDILFNGAPGYTALQLPGNTQFEIVAVPEPSTTALLAGAALLGLFGFRRRRQAAGRA